MSKQIMKTLWQCFLWNLKAVEICNVSKRHLETCFNSSHLSKSFKENAFLLPCSCRFSFFSWRFL